MLPPFGQALFVDVGLPAQRANLGSQIVAGSGAAQVPWTALFDRTSGWTGADGVYSIPLVENDRLSSGVKPSSRTFFTFSDTFIGTVNPDRTRSPGSYLIRNTTALLSGALPDPAAMQFNFRTGAGGAAQPIFPNNPNGSWFWPVDGATVGNDLYLFSLRMKPVSGGFGFDYEGITLFSTPISSGNLNNTPPLFTTYTQLDNTGLFVPSPGGSTGSRIFGQAVLNNTVQGGAFFPDGYLYIYGVRNDFLNKRLIVARVPRDSIGDPTQYRFFNGTAWVAGAANAQPLIGADHLSSEFSVTPMPDGRYLMVFSYDDIFGNRIAARYANSPTGPWSLPIFLYTCPETALTPNAFVYGAKAHPALSRPGELLISYHVNSYEFGEHYQNADLYRPRFITVSLAGASPIYNLDSANAFSSSRRVIELDDLLASRQGAEALDALPLHG